MSVPVPSAAPDTTENTTTAAATTTTTTADIGEAGGESSSFGQRFANAVTVTPPRPGTMTRLKYASYLFAALLFCLVFRSLLSKFFGAIPYYREACAVSTLVKTTTTTTVPSPPGHHWTIPAIPSNPANIIPDMIKHTLFSNVCLEATVVYRISFSLFMFFILHFCCVTDLTCCIQDSVRDEMQSGYFGVKTFLLTLLNLVAFAMPTEFFAYYAWACMYASAIFLVIQIIIFVDFAYEWNESWGARSEENEKWMWYLLIITVLCFVIGIGLTGYGFSNFTPHEDCNLHGFLLIANVMVAFICIGVAIWVPHGSLLPTGILFSYTTYLVISALRSSPDTRCGGTGGDEFEPNTSWYNILFTSLLTAGALAYTASSVGGSDEEMSMNTAAPQEQYTGHLPAYLYFHGVMVLASMYLAMLGTDWTVSGTDGGKTGGALVSFWVKIVSSWLTYAVYFWSLLAPYFCCKHRDYGYDADLPENW